MDDSYTALQRHNGAAPMSQSATALSIVARLAEELEMSASDLLAQ
jgi:hypothetical protein